MDEYCLFPNRPIAGAGAVSSRFLGLGIDSFHRACRWVHNLPYGCNTNRDDLMILFEEKMGTCTTKHAVIATLAVELKLAVEKNIGIYAMTEAIVTGTAPILDKYGLPYVPMIHCFLTDGEHRVDLTEGNANGKNRPIDDFLATETVIPNIAGKNEYLKYRNALKKHILKRNELQGIDIKTILHAREEGLELLKANLKNDERQPSGLFPQCPKPIPACYRRRMTSLLSCPASAQIETAGPGCGAAQAIPRVQPLSPTFLSPPVPNVPLFPD